MEAVTEAPDRSTRRPWLLTAGQSSRVGRIGRQIRRALIAAGKPLSTVELVAYAYPRQIRFERWQFNSVRRAAPRYAVRIGRRRCRGLPIV